MGEAFVQAERNLAKYAKGVNVAADPRAVVPERCLVFELLGDVPQFNLAAQALGLEWLATEVATEEADALADAEEIEGESNDPAKQPPQRLYLTMPTERALASLLNQWKAYERGRAPDEDHKSLWKLFDYLHNLRVWSVADRMDASLARYVSNALEAQPDRPVTIELDLWYRTEAERRDQSLDTLREMLVEVDGTLLDAVDINEISYQGALIQVPPAVARTLIQGKGRIAAFDDVMTIRPQSVYESRIEGAEGDAPTEQSSDEPEIKRAGIAALLDGYPIDQHSDLAGRLEVIEVDVTSEDAPANTRSHGTAMASLIIHGDLQSPDRAPLHRPLVVLPVLAAPSRHLRESTPAGKLPIGVIYRALKAIVTRNDGESTELERVVVINHSICDDYAPFVRRPSPWSTLLDYFAHHHRLLFVVSAGNIYSAFPISAYRNLAEFNAEDPIVRQAAILGAIEMAKGVRGLLSPGECINGLTVGATHFDHAPSNSHAPIDPYPTFAMSNLASALGLGPNRSVKPDLLAHGGRFAVGVANIRGGIEVHAKAASAHFGQEVAAPSPSGSLNRRIKTAGTSNAAALVTRAAHFIADAVEDVFSAEGADWTKRDTRAVILKTLLVHGCSWGDIGETLDAAYPPRDRRKWSERRNTITRFLGYGQLNTDRVVSGGVNRITLLGDDSIKSGRRHEYVIPVPGSMLNNREVRTCTVTLTWSCPTTHTTTDHRAVVLQLSGENNSSAFWSGVDRSGCPQPNISTANRGTVIHVIQDGKKLMKDHSGRIVIGVQAAAKAGFEDEAAPYAIAITLEIAQQQRSHLYAEVEQQVRARTRTR